MTQQNRTGHEMLSAVRFQNYNWKTTLIKPRHYPLRGYKHESPFTPSLPLPPSLQEVVGTQKPSWVQWLLLPFAPFSPFTPFVSFTSFILHFKRWWGPLGASVGFGRCGWPQEPKAPWVGKRSEEEQRGQREWREVKEPPDKTFTTWYLSLYPCYFH